MSKTDITPKLRIISLIALIIVLIVVGFFIINDSKSEKKISSYLDNLPEWATTYDTHLQKYYKKPYEIAFIDLDFDDEPEGIIKQSNKKSISFTIIDLNEESNIASKYNDINDIGMIYSHNNKTVSWYMSTSLADGKLHIIDIKKRIKDSNEYEQYLDSSDLNDFKKNNVNVDYTIKYTILKDENYETNFIAAVEQYNKENKIINKIIKETIN